MAMDDRANVARLEFRRGKDSMYFEMEEYEDMDGSMYLTLAHSFPGIVYGYSSLTPLNPDQALLVAERMILWAHSKGGKSHVCGSENFVKVDHEENAVDWAERGSTQSYQVYKCPCGAYWGCRHQYDEGTGHDDRWHRFGFNIEEVKRHY
jgi:hypothetical protein